MIGYKDKYGKINIVSPTGRWYIQEYYRWCSTEKQILAHELVIECERNKTFIDKPFNSKYFWLSENNIIWINECSNK